MASLPVTIKGTLAKGGILNPIPFNLANIELTVNVFVKLYTLCVRGITVNFHFIFFDIPAVVAGNDTVCLNNSWRPPAGCAGGW